MAEHIQPFIRASHRMDLLLHYLQERGEQLEGVVDAHLVRATDVDVPKLDGKAGAAEFPITLTADGKKDGKEKEGKDGDKGSDKAGEDTGKEASDSKFGGAENELVRYGDEAVLPASAFTRIEALQRERIKLSSNPIF